jgi:hypothetical protein
MSRKFLQRPIKHWEPYGPTERVPMPYCFLCEGPRRRFVKVYVHAADGGGKVYGFQIGLCHRHIGEKDYARKIDEKLWKIFGPRDGEDGKTT